MSAKIEEAQSKEETPHKLPDHPTIPTDADLLELAFRAARTVEEMEFCRDRLDEVKSKAGLPAAQREWLARIAAQGPRVRINGR